jgi:hypothetical protein
MKSQPNQSDEKPTNTESDPDEKTNPQNPIRKTRPVSKEPSPYPMKNSCPMKSRRIPESRLVKLLSFPFTP